MSTKTPLWARSFLAHFPEAYLSFLGDSAVLPGWEARKHFEDLAVGKSDERMELTARSCGEFSESFTVEAGINYGPTVNSCRFAGNVAAICAAAYAADDAAWKMHPEIIRGGKYFKI